MKKIANFLFVILLLTAFRGKAQLLNTTSAFFQPRIIAYGEYEAQWKNDEDKSSANLGYSKAYLNFSIPVLTHSRQLNDSNKWNAWSFKVKGLEVLGFPRSDVFFTNHILIKTSPGLGFNYLFHSKNMLALNGSLLLADDQITVTSPQDWWIGSALYTRITDHKFSYSLGAGYSYVYGLRSLLPMVGASVITGSKSKIAVLFPLSAQYMHYVNDKIEYRVFVQPSGSVNRFSNLDSINSLNSVLLFKRREYQAGLSLLNHISANYTWKISAGVTFDRRMALSNNDKSFENARYNLSLSPGFFINAGIICTLPSVNRHKQKPGDEDPDQLLKLGIDIDDLLQ